MPVPHFRWPQGQETALLRELPDGEAPTATRSLFTEATRPATGRCRPVAVELLSHKQSRTGKRFTSQKNKLTSDGTPTCIDALFLALAPLDIRPSTAAAQSSMRGHVWPRIPVLQLPCKPRAGARALETVAVRLL